jgi:hypothetical protein
MSELISAVALIVSLCVLWYTIRHNRKMASHQYWSSSEALYVQLEQALNKSPNILRFHGIDEDIEKTYGITIDELSYLLPIFTAGGINDRTVGNNVKVNNPFELDGYYGQLLSSKHTVKAWPLIRKLMSPSNYRSRLEATIELIKQLENQKSIKSDKMELPPNLSLLID